MEELLESILKLNTEERRQLLEAVWDSVEKEEIEAAAALGNTTPDWQMELVRKRIEHRKANPTNTYTWSEVKERIKGKQ